MFLLIYRLLSKVACYILKYKYKSKSALFYRDTFVLYDKSSLKKKSSKPKIWIHGVSVGEIQTAINFSKYLEENGFDVFFTCKTDTAYSLLQKSTNNEFFYIPLDTPKLINKFLELHLPDIVIFLESEIWPNIVYEISKKSIPMYLVNARLSTSSVQRWKKIKRTFTKVLNKFNLIIAQSAMDAKKFKIFLKDNVFFVGNLKYAVSVDKNIQKTNDKIIIAAASTHNGEEELILKSFKKLKEIFDKNVILIIAPRHVDRVKHEIIPLLKEYNYQLRSKSKNLEINDSTEVYVLDTIGELTDFYKKSHIAIIGGSFLDNKIGGHNIFEAGIAKNIIIHGPYMSNQFEMKLAFKDLAYEVKDSKELTETIKNLICNKNNMINIANKTYDMALSLNNSIVSDTIGLIKKDLKNKLLIKN